ncbi:Hypothetical protein, putative [Bodo saltans]|uniref:Uncharacterized protein n=1 Tax=Bodo saltans TaxID=75058 RepID=A0A0S4IX64_BODSA|nr:Hypothetical protein, putative [Bodo saltans]|eukprot:CUG06818.1 Hypothetical protein, putative [Bodo saltans]
MGSSCSSLEVKPMIDPTTFRSPVTRRSSMTEMLDVAAVATAFPILGGGHHSNNNGGGGDGVVHESNTSRKRMNAGGSCTGSVVGSQTGSKSSRRNPLAGSTHSGHQSPSQVVKSHRSNASSMTSEHQMNSGSSQISSRRQRVHGIVPTVSQQHQLLQMQVEHHIHNHRVRSASASQRGGGYADDLGSQRSRGGGNESTTDPVLFPLGLSVTSIGGRGASGAEGSAMFQQQHPHFATVQLTSAQNQQSSSGMPLAEGEGFDDEYGVDEESIRQRSTRVLSGDSVASNHNHNVVGGGGGGANMLMPPTIPFHIVAVGPRHFKFDTTTSNTTTTTTTTSSKTTGGASSAVIVPVPKKQGNLHKDFSSSAAEYSLSGGDGGEDGEHEFHPLPVVLPPPSAPPPRLDASATVLSADAMISAGTTAAQSTATTISSLHQMFQEARMQGQSLLPSFGGGGGDYDDEGGADEYGLPEYFP